MNLNKASFLGLAALLAAFLLLSACSGPRSAMAPPASQPAPPQPQHRAAAIDIPEPARDGSLWEPSGPLSSLFLDAKARKVGDIVTVRIEESSSATNQANTKAGRGSSLEAGIDKLFGLENWWGKKVNGEGNDFLPKVSPFGNPSVKGSLSSEFDGSGTTSRKGDLSAFITCRVTELLPNGNLRIVGSREVLVNHETQLIILSGVIRPRDIGQDNTVKSTFVADARIAYSGSGVIDDRQRPGWLANALNTIWPF